MNRNKHSDKMEAHKFNVDVVKMNNHCIHSGQGQTSDAKPRQKKKKMSLVEIKKKVDLVKPSGAKSKAKKVVTPGKTKKSGSLKRRRVGINDVYDDIEAKFSVLERAARVLASLEGEFPYFLKYMLPSNVAYSFWLIIPRKFGALHLPSQDSTVILVDECGKEFKTTYLIDRNGLSAGWRGFSLAHRLLKGDILIFRLIAPCKLQVHIVRVNGSDVINAAQCLMNMEAIGKTTDSDIAKDNGKRKKAKKYAECYLLDVPKVEGGTKGKRQMLLKSDLVPSPKKSEDCSEGFDSEVLEGSETPNHLLSGDLHSTKASILREHPFEGVACT